MSELYINYANQYPIFITSALITLLPILIMLFRGETKNTSRIFFLYLICQLIFDVAGVHLACLGLNNLLLCNIWHLVILILMSQFFISIFKDVKVKKVILYSTYVFFFIFALDILYVNDNILDIQNHKYALVSPLLSSLLIVLMCLWFFYELHEEIVIDNLYRSDIVWIINAVLIYHCFSVFAISINNWYLVWEHDKSLLSVVYIPFMAYSFSMIILSFGLIVSKKE